MRLSEREGQTIAAQLNAGGLPGVLAWLKERYQRTGRRAFAARLLRYGPALVGAELTQQAADKLGADMAEGLTRALSQLLAKRQQELASAVRDAAQGVTLTFTFKMPGKAAPRGAAIPDPTVTVRAGTDTLPPRVQAPPPEYASSRSRPRA
jgi:hypothetical protein